jgi:hypothetical protein
MRKEQVAMARKKSGTTVPRMPRMPMMPDMPMPGMGKTGKVKTAKVVPGKMPPPPKKRA